MSRPHREPIPTPIPQRMTHARVVQCAAWLAQEVADAGKRNRHTVAVPLATATALADVLLEVASRNPEEWR